MHSVLNLLLYSKNSCQKGTLLKKPPNPNQPSTDRNQCTSHLPSNFFARVFLMIPTLEGSLIFFSTIMPFPDRDAKSGIAFFCTETAENYSQTLMSLKSITSLSFYESSSHWHDVPWARHGTWRDTFVYLFHTKLLHYNVPSGCMTFSLGLQ